MKRLYFALRHSLAGLRVAYRDEAAFREEIWAALIALPAAFYFAPGHIELALMGASVLLVLVVELLNTAIEAAIDRHGPEIHPLAKKAKDAASASVLVALILAGFVWVACLV